MPDPIVDPAPSVEPAVQPDPPAAPKADEPLGGPGLKALQAEREARAEAERKLAVFEAAQDEAEKAKLSDIERATTEAAEARKEAEAAKAEALRLRIAAKHGISDEEDMELFLTGTDEATLTRQAERLAARVATPGTPKADPSSGAKSGVESHSVADQIAAAEKDGDRAAASRLKAQQLGALANNQN